MRTGGLVDVEAARILAHRLQPLGHPAEVGQAVVEGGPGRPGRLERARGWRAAGRRPRPATRLASSESRRSSRVCPSCSYEKTTALPPLRTTLRTICMTIVVLPSPCGPPSRTSSPDRNPPSSARSSTEKPDGTTAAPGRTPRWIASSVPGQEVGDMLLRRPSESEVAVVMSAKSSSPRPSGVRVYPEPGPNGHRSQRDADVLGLEVLLDPLEAALAPEPALLDARRTVRPGSTRCPG